MDIKGAFDYVVWAKLIGGLRDTGLRSARDARAETAE